MSRQTRVISLDMFDLSKTHERVLARRFGFDVPHRAKGVRPMDIESQLDKSGECWTWPRTRNRDGYGVLRREGRTVLIHRYMWEKANDRSASGLVILHSCDNPACANPAHLRAGTTQENRADCVAKGRMARGERSGTSKLTEGQVREIRWKALVHGVTYRVLAAEYGVHHNSILKIVNRKYWGHVA